MDTTTANPSQKCKDKNRRGEPCGAWAGAGSEYCFWHDPATARDRHKARRAGGQARHGRRIGTTGQAEPVTIGSVDDVVRLLERTINDTLGLETSLQRARTIGYLAGVILKAWEISEMEQRFDALEKALEARQ